jgi:ATP-grasp domain, R2K clade family 3
MHWILQNNLFNEDAYQTLLETLQRQGLPYSIHKVIPFIGELTEPEAPVVDGSVICMGSYSMRHAAVKHGWTPGVFDLEPFDFQVQLQHWGSEMFNADSVVTTFGDAKFPEGAERMFVRPVADSKVFAGTVIEVAEFEEWQRKVCVLEEDFGNSLTKDTLIQVSEPKAILAEYRFWIVKGEIVSASLYKRGRYVIYSDQVDDFYADYVRKRIAEWCPHEAFCIDICSTAYELKIMEIGTINSCGFYACNIPKLVDALESAFNKEKETTCTAT